MKFSLSRAIVIARREYLTTIRRKAFLFTLIGMPIYFAGVMYLSIRPQIGERVDALRRFTSLGVVDSSGLFANASHEIQSDAAPDPINAPQKRLQFRTQVRFYSDWPAAEAGLRAGDVTQVLVVPSDYLTSGKLKRYARSNSIFSSAEERPIQRWLARNLIATQLAAPLAERAARPSVDTDLYTLSKEGNFELKDDRREVAEFLVPFVFAMLMGLCIVVGGQYLLQGVAEEKESRILESLMCSATPQDLLAGKLVGLGGAGLTLVVSWLALGAIVTGPGLAFAGTAMPLKVPPLLVALAFAYFVLGYLFYGSIMTGIGAVTNNMREAQQFSVMFTFMNFVPMLFLNMIMNKPDGPVAVALSMIPPTASVAMLLRQAMPSANVPLWQVALSLGLLGLSGWTALMISARIFRIGLLMYGKTPNLPEILRWIRQN
jgi:ABC-2 type transport system permease protein